MILYRKEKNKIIKSKSPFTVENAWKQKMFTTMGKRGLDIKNTHLCIFNTQMHRRKVPEILNSGLYFHFVLRLQKTGTFPPKFLLRGFFSRNFFPVTFLHRFVHNHWNTDRVHKLSLYNIHMYYCTSGMHTSCLFSNIWNHDILNNVHPNLQYTLSAVWTSPIWEYDLGKFYQNNLKYYFKMSDFFGKGMGRSGHGPLIEMPLSIDLL